MLKARFLGYIFVADSMGLSSFALTYLATKAAEFGRIKPNNGHYAVQGQSMSPILIQSKAHVSLPLTTRD